MTILSICLLVFFCCGLNFAQLEDVLQTDSCVSKTKFDAMKEKLEALETMLRASETRLINNESQINEQNEQGRLNMWP